VKFTEANKQALGFKIVISCEACEPVYINSCPKINNKAYEVNRRMVLAMRLLGISLNGIKQFCAFMDLPQYFKKATMKSSKLSARYPSLFVLFP